ncbi:TonB-dependent receptor [Novosphingobium mangrovi (ex Hu et al. 2023)]|uniref:TonB-dependent receptor n=1 Tax=Novosphingobium mangrovi (ex Hu et al. 2023) TaxID=2930094 RepID=A0ABT0AER9_9SPHN|nr:TonB-dependent receptor [Novosphingobium mangrovi (ex Hu et al. 2023)]MCJ1961689.1 TonB-dependent receptor [Novosphingobium mangrovi (ex Hu et al. 2023)]
MQRMTCLRATLSLGTLAVALIAGAAPALAETAEDDATGNAAGLTAAAAAADAADEAGGNAIIVTAAKTTRSATELDGVEVQKILPGVSPLRAVQAMPGVMYQTADPWGNNEQNMSLFIHGFAINQLGYSLDGMPLGDLSYGNIAGITPQRAMVSETMGNVVVSTGAGDLAMPSNINLGGGIEMTTSDPKAKASAEVRQTVGSYGTSRTFVRLDTGEFDADGTNAGYVSVVRHRARAWDFDGRQGGWQANGKFVHENDAGKLTLYAAFSDKQEPNEDGTTTFVNPANDAQAYMPYVRPFMYPDFQAALDYVDENGDTPPEEGSNYLNYFSAALRTDYIGYLKYDANLGSNTTWTNQVYYHHNDGQGVVAGPLGQSISVVAAYYPELDRAGQVEVTGESGYVTRVTEYRIDRAGALSTLRMNLGNHNLQAGAWFEHNSGTTWRKWYALDVNAPTDPYHWQKDELFTQYSLEYRVNTLQLHLQDEWNATDRLTVLGGFKSSLVFSEGWYPIQPVAGSYSGMDGGLPSGSISTKRWFLPAIGARYDFNGTEEIYFNIQKNMRNYGTAPWGQGSQAAFDYFKDVGRPETSWTYEAGLRSHHVFPGSFLSSLDAQINYYHVDFSNRLLSISTTVGGLGGGSITGGTSTLFNVGGVKTDGVDASITLGLGSIFSIYNALSFNSSRYGSDYTDGTTVFATDGKQVPGSPKWMNKTMISANFGPIDAQIEGQYIGKRYATYTNDGVVDSYYMANARIAFDLAGYIPLEKASVSLNVTNLFDEKGASTISTGRPSAVYATFPLAPRQWFLTFTAGI